MSLFEHRVGHGATHASKADLRTARILLNANLFRINGFRAAGGGPPLAPLPEQGHLTTADRQALNDRIGEFQRWVSAPDKKPDSRIDPDGATEKSLLRGLPAGFSALKLALVMPEAYEANIAAYAPQLDKLMPAYGIDTPLRQAHFLAQLAVESDNLKAAEEYASGAEYEGRADLGNTEPGDGKRFKGRGLIQLTGRDNYQAFGDEKTLSLTELADDANRQKLKSDPGLAVEVSCWFWKTNALNTWADADNVLNVTKIVNAGSIAVSVAALHGYPERKAFSLRAKAVLVPPVGP